MKTAFVVMLFAASALAQNQSAPAVTACGPGNVSFKVKLDETAHPLVQPEQGKALVYFIHEAGTTNGYPLVAYPTLKLGMDGAWMGANHGDSYFSVAVEPGERHLCATLQSSIVDDRVVFAHFQAEAGKVYYYRTRLVLSAAVALLQLETVDSDEGKYLVSSYPRSISQPKK